MEYVYRKISSKLVRKTTKKFTGDQIRTLVKVLVVTGYRICLQKNLMGFLVIHVRLFLQVRIEKSCLTRIRELYSRFYSNLTSYVYDLTV